jgi:glutathionylspermidine synthase
MGTATKTGAPFRPLQAVATGLDFGRPIVLLAAGAAHRILFRHLHLLRAGCPAVPKAGLAAHPAPAAGRAVAEIFATEYMRRRENLYGPLRADGIFTWDSMYGDEYALASVLPIATDLCQQLRTAAERLGGVYARTAEILLNCDDELLAELGLPEAAWSAVRASLPSLLPTLIGRFDFAATPAGIKMLEFNAETPTDIVEAFYVNEKVCQFFDVINPNHDLEKKIAPAFERAILEYSRSGNAVARIVFSSVEWHDEDAGTTRYLLNQSGLAARFVPLSQLRVYDDRLQVWDGQNHTPIDLMYRLHPLEKLAEEQDGDGYPTGRHVLEIVAGQKLALINPPAAMLAQSKATQALIWSLHEDGSFFTPTEHEAIADHMLPTYFENRFQGRCAYVTKPIYGREGGAVTVFGADGVAWARDEELNYWEQPVVYQQYVELPKHTVETLHGLYCGRIIYGTFLLDGSGSGIVCRVGSRITGNMAYYQPVCISTDASKGE